MNRIASVVLAVGLALGCGESNDASVHGTLEVLRYDHVETQRTWTELYLRTEDGRIRLELRKGTAAPELATGNEVTARGAWLTANTFSAGEVEMVGTQGAALEAEPTPTQRKTAILLFNFTNDRSRPFTPNTARARLFTQPDSTNAFYQEQSFGFLKFVGKVHPAGDVYGWFTLPVANQPCDPDGWAEAAQRAAAKSGANLSGYDHLLFVFPEGTSCGWSGISHSDGALSWYHANHFPSLAPYQLGTNLGLLPAAALSCRDPNGKDVTYSDKCNTLPYGDLFDVMGMSRIRHTSGWGKARMGWLKSENKATATADGVYTLSPLETPSAGVQSLRIFSHHAAGLSYFYYLDFRQPYGQWDNFAANDPVVNGVTVRLAADHAQAEAPSLLDTTPGSHSDEGGDFVDAPLAVGRTYADSARGLSIETLSVSPSGAQVRVKLGNTGPAPAAGTGLKAEYFDTADLTQLKRTRTDARIDFDWGTGAPDSQVGADSFSVRWSGFVQPQFTETYTFHTTTDDGVRLWVNGRLLIDDWVDHSPATHSASIALTAGKKVALQMEYYDRGAGALARLAWSSPQTPRAVIPQSQLFPAGSSLFWTGFEPGETQPTWNDSVDWKNNVAGYCCGLTDPETSIRQEDARMGTHALVYSGDDLNAGVSHSYSKVFDVNISVRASTVLSYWIRPQFPNGTYVAVDLIFTDGSSLRDSGAVDQWGVRVHPELQGSSGKLKVNTWNFVRSTIGAQNAGKTIDRILVGYDRGPGTGTYRGHIDDIVITR